MNKPSFLYKKLLITIVTAILLGISLRPSPAVLAYGGFTLPFYGGASQWAISCDFACHQDRPSPLGGDDYVMPTGTPVLAAGGGYVTISTDTFQDGQYAAGSYGNYIVIDHLNGYVTYYGHLQHNSLIDQGTTVAQGQQIALSDNTGTSTGEHLHFEVRRYGTAVDPYADSSNPSSSKYLWTTNPPSSPPSPLTGGVSGRVKDIAGNPVNGAIVTLLLGSAKFPTKSDSTGMYTRYGIPTGLATIRAIFNGQAGSVTAQIYANRSVIAPDIWLNQCAQTMSALGTSSSCGPVVTPVPQPTPLASGWNETFFSDNNLGTQCGSPRNETDVYMFRDSDGGWSPPSGCPGVESSWSVRMVRNDAWFDGGELRVRSVLR